MTTRRNFLAANLIGAAGLAANPIRIFSDVWRMLHSLLRHIRLVPIATSGLIGQLTLPQK